MAARWRRWSAGFWLLLCAAAVGRASEPAEPGGAKPDRSPAARDLVVFAYEQPDAPSASAARVRTVPGELPVWFPPAERPGAAEGGPAADEAAERPPDAAPAARSRWGGSRDTMPADSVVVRHGDRQYSWYAGYCYAPVVYGDRTVYVGVRPPEGLACPSLPEGCRVYYYGSVPHYYHSGVYYKAAGPTDDGPFVVTVPPEDTRERPSGTAAAGPGQDPYAILARMSDFMAAQDEFRLEVDEDADGVSPAGLTMRLGAHLTVLARRPDALQIRVRGDAAHCTIWFGAGGLSRYDALANTFSTVEAVAGLDEMLGVAARHHGLAMPLADLLCGDVYGRIAPRTISGVYVGLHQAAGVACHHLAFEGSTTDWQFWIEDGDRPVLRKLVVTDRSDVRDADYCVVVPQWDLAPGLGEEDLRFSPPADPQQIDAASHVPEDASAGALPPPGAEPEA